MLSRGAFIIQREIWEWEWMSSPNHYYLFSFFISIANFKAVKYKGVAIPRGSFIRTIAQIEEQIPAKLTKKQIWKIIHDLKKTGELGTIKIGRSLMYSVTNYSTHQDLGKRQGNVRETSGKQYKNVKNEKNDIKSKKGENFLAAIEDIYTRCYPRKKGRATGLKKLCQDIKTEQDLQALQLAVNNYAEEVKDDEEKFIKHFSSFATCWKDYVYNARPQITKQPYKSKDGRIHEV